MFQAGSLIAREEGVRALWKGLTPFSTQLCAKYALRFSTNAFYQGLMRDKDGNLGYENGFMSWFGPNAEAYMRTLRDEIVNKMGASPLRAQNGAPLQGAPANS